MTTLYAWVRPLDIEPALDHTWVTDYAPPPVYDNINEVIAAGKHYWYCWGSYHPEGVSQKYPGGAIGHAPGNLAMSSCICAPNDAKAHGTIYSYGIDGVCHQLANQVLYSTDGPLTVKLARGYFWSSLLYGTYGREDQDWHERIAHCSTQEGSMVSTPPDDFEIQFNKVMGDNIESETYGEMMKIRKNFQNDIRALGDECGPDDDPQAIARKANELIESYRSKALEVLGPDRFRQIFETEPDQPLNLVDHRFIDPGKLKK